MKGGRKKGRKEGEREGARKGNKGLKGRGKEGLMKHI